LEKPKTHFDFVFQISKLPFLILFLRFSILKRFSILEIPSKNVSYLLGGPSFRDAFLKAEDFE